MNRFAYQQNQQKNVMVAYGGEMRWGESFISVSGNGVVCPKPRRLGFLDSSFKDQTRPSKCYQTEICDSKAGTELLDILLTKGREKSNTFLASSPPSFYCGSPPSRASNPLIQDAEFGNSNLYPSSPAEEAPLVKNGGFIRVKLGHKPADVRIEGFNCPGISAVA